MNQMTIALTGEKVYQEKAGSLKEMESRREQDESGWPLGPVTKNQNLEEMFEKKFQPDD